MKKKGGICKCVVEEKKKGENKEREKIRVLSELNRERQLL